MNPEITPRGRARLAFVPALYLVGAIIAASILAPAQVARAEDNCDAAGIGGGCPTEENPSNPVVPTPTDPGGSGTPVGGGNQPAWSCSRGSIEADRFQFVDVKDDDSVWAYFVFTCTAPGFPDNVFPQLSCFMRCPPNLAPVTPPPVVTPEEIRASAYAEVQPVAPSFSVEPDSPVVGVPTFLHMPDAAARQGNDAGGGFTVAVTATLTEVRWTLGRESRTCSTGGGAFTPARLDQAMAQPDGLVDNADMCTFLFTTSSDKSNGGPLNGSVQTVWDYSWSVNGTNRGTFNTGVTSPASNFTLDVREYQAVITD